MHRSAVGYDTAGKSISIRPDFGRGDDVINDPKLPGAPEASTDEKGQSGKRLASHESRMRFRDDTR
jgi:hypothetical protein